MHNLTILLLLLSPLLLTSYSVKAPLSYTDSSIIYNYFDTYPNSLLYPMSFNEDKSQMFYLNDTNHLLIFNKKYSQEYRLANEIELPFNMTNAITKIRVSNDATRILMEAKMVTYLSTFIDGVFTFNATLIDSCKSVVDFSPDGRTIICQVLKQNIYSPQTYETTNNADIFKDLLNDLRYTKISTITKVSTYWHSFDRPIFLKQSDSFIILNYLQNKNGYVTQSSSQYQIIKYTYKTDGKQHNYVNNLNYSLQIKDKNTKLTFTSNQQNVHLSPTDDLIIFSNPYHTELMIIGYKNSQWQLIQKLYNQAGAKTKIAVSPSMQFLLEKKENHGILMELDIINLRYYLVLEFSIPTFVSQSQILINDEAEIFINNRGLSVIYPTSFGSVVFPSKEGESMRIEHKQIAMEDDVVRERPLRPKLEEEGKEEEEEEEGKEKDIQEEDQSLIKDGWVELCLTISFLALIGVLRILVKQNKKKQIEANIQKIKSNFDNQTELNGSKTYDRPPQTYTINQSNNKLQTKNQSSDKPIKKIDLDMNLWSQRRNK